MAAHAGLMKSNPFTTSLEEALELYSERGGHVLMGHALALGTLEHILRGFRSLKASTR